MRDYYATVMPSRSGSSSALPPLPAHVVESVARGEAGPLDAWLDSDDTMDCIDSVDMNGRTLLMVAIVAGRMDMALHLIEYAEPVCRARQSAISQALAAQCTRARSRYS